MEGLFKSINLNSAAALIGSLFFFSAACVPKSTVNVQTGGGSNSDSVVEGKGGEKTTTSAEQDPIFYCAPQFRIMKFGNQNGAFCVENDKTDGNKTKAVGPFPDAMVKKCVASKGGKACDETEKVRWVADFTLGLRGAARCPTGTTHVKEFEVCIDENYAYGPFKHAQVKACEAIAAKQDAKAKFKIVCDSLRWSKNYFPRNDIQKIFFSSRRTGPGKAELDLNKFKPLQQVNGRACGRTNVAMAVNYLKGTQLTEDSFPGDGFAVADSLNNETGSLGITWTDAGNLDSSTADVFWPRIEEALSQNLPVIVGVGGRFTATDGHIITIVGVNGSKVKYADSASGVIKDDTTKTEITNAQGFRQGNFIILPRKK